VHQLGYLHAKRLLLKLGDLAQHVVVVGGQAVNFWAHWYRETDSSQVLRTFEPFTSKDVDVAAGRQEVALLAQRLGGRPKVADLDDHAPQSGTVVYVDDDGVERTLDVMGTLVGIDMAELKETSVAIAYETDSGAELRFAVMHPVLMLESRACNVFELVKYRTDHGMRQLRAAVICARQYLIDMAVTDPRGAMKWNERIFRFRTKVKAGKGIADEHQVDVFDAIAVCAEFPEAFIAKRYPQMQAQVARLRKRATSVP
jgi:hypothetical protein